MTTPNDVNGPSQPSLPPQGPAGGQFQPPPPPGAYPPPYPYPAYPPPPQAKSSGIGSRVATYLISSILILSLALNVYFIVLASVAMRNVPKVSTSVYQKGEKDHRIVIIPIEGMITEPTFHFFRNALKSVDTNPPPKAIVLRVDSGGGAVGACDRMWNELDRYRQKHPSVKIVASFGSISASGGYYISTKSDYIMAEPVCTTGSIGVIAPVMTFDGLLEKIGVTPETIVAEGSPKKAVANDITRPWTDEDRRKLRDVLDFAHERFVEVVKGGFEIRFPIDSERPSDEQIEALADGSIFNTDEAVENKLIDEEGYLDAAIDKAASLAGVPANEMPHVTRVDQIPDLFSVMFSEQKQPSMSSLDGDTIRNWLIEAGTPRLEYRFELLQP